MINRILPVALTIALIITSCIYKQPDIEHIAGFTQGTSYSILYDNKNKLQPDEVKLQVEKILKDFDMSLSTYQDSSIISKINRNEEVMPDSFFIDVFKQAVLISEMTSGAFDITVGPLVRAWGFGTDAKKSFNELKHDSLMKLVGMKKV